MDLGFTRYQLDTKPGLPVLENVPIIYMDEEK